MADLGSVLFSPAVQSQNAVPEQRPVRAGKGDLLQASTSEPGSLADFLFRPPETTFGQGFLRGLSETLINNVANAPLAPGRLVNAALEGIVYLTDSKREFAEPLAIPEGSSDPAQLLNTVEGMIPSATDVLAAGDTAVSALQGLTQGERLDLAERFRAAQVGQQEASQRLRQQAPVGAFMGDIVADGLTLAGARVPNAVGLGQRAPLAEKAAQVAQSQARVTIPSIAKNVATSGPVKGLLRAVGRAGEAGLEGAFLASLKSDDPLDIAAVTAGSGLGQLGGSAVLPLLPTSKKGFGGLALTAAGLFTAFRLMQEAAPGQNNIFTAIDQSFEKIALGIMAGTTAYLTGAGRVRPRNASAVVSIMSDGLTALPRGSMISIWNEFLTDQKSGRSVIENGFAALAADPGGFTASEQRQIQRAIKDPKVSLAETFEKLGIGTDQ